jgi:hypothetical protein
VREQTLEFIKYRPILGSDGAMQKQLISRAFAAWYPGLRFSFFRGSAPHRR